MNGYTRFRLGFIVCNGNHNLILSHEFFPTVPGQLRGATGGKSPSRLIAEDLGNERKHIDKIATLNTKYYRLDTYYLFRTKWCESNINLRLLGL